MVLLDRNVFSKYFAHKFDSKHSLALSLVWTEYFSLPWRGENTPMEYCVKDSVRQ